MVPRWRFLCAHSPSELSRKCCQLEHRWLSPSIGRPQCLLLCIHFMIIVALSWKCMGACNGSVNEAACFNHLIALAPAFTSSTKKVDSVYRGRACHTRLYPEAFAALAASMSARGSSSRRLDILYASICTAVVLRSVTCWCSPIQWGLDHRACMAGAASCCLHQGITEQSQAVPTLWVPPERLCHLVMVGCCNMPGRHAQTPGTAAGTVSAGRE